MSMPNVSEITHYIIIRFKCSRKETLINNKTIYDT